MCCVLERKGGNPKPLRSSTFYAPDESQDHGHLHHHSHLQHRQNRERETAQQEAVTGRPITIAIGNVTKM